MIEDNTNYQDMTQGVDRITDILRRQSTPVVSSPIVSQASQLPVNLLNALAYSSYDPGNGRGGDFASKAQEYQANQQNQELNQQKMLLQAYDAKLKMGDAQAKALDDKLTLFTGNDPDGKAMFLEALHADPDPIDPSNSYQLMTKLAGIKKKMGYESPDLKMANEKQQLDNDYKRSMINANNSLVAKRNAGAGAGSSAVGADKPMPVGAVKLQQEGLDAIGTANSIDADLGQVIAQVKNGKLVLGPLANPINAAMNYAGISNEESRNFATFKNTLEKLRNDSLRLNKGVQTEGDSQRAWNEILTNLNDEELVKQRLDEVQQINRRAAELHKMNINELRANYGREPLDTSGYNVKPAIMTGKNIAPPTPEEEAEYRRLKGL
jgi:hypothetical protein